MRAVLFVAFMLSVGLISCGEKNDYDLKTRSSQMSLGERIDKEFEYFLAAVDDSSARRSVEEIVDLSVESQMKFTRFLVSKKSWSAVKSGRCVILNKNLSSLENSGLDSGVFELSRNSYLAFTKDKNYGPRECQQLVKRGSFTTLFYAFY